ncbi:MAG: hypothetical protein WBN94_12360, partial [Methanothrix sp.]
QRATLTSETASADALRTPAPLACGRPGHLCPGPGRDPGEPSRRTRDEARPAQRDDMRFKDEQEPTATRQPSAIVATDRPGPRGDPRRKGIR